MKTSPLVIASAPGPMLRPALVLFTALSLICGIIYPVVVTGIGKVAFADKAAGSLIIQNGKTVGSRLIGQEFSAPEYFWGRLSATSPMPYNATSSGGSNFGPSNPALIEAVKGRVAALKAVDPTNTLSIPVDLVTASGSGLDPEMSTAAAYYQAARVARERKLSIEVVRGIIDAKQLTRSVGFLGEPRINVLDLNLALDQKH
ncbi:potassium-transporting ATPase subunit KdpC [Glaciimonas sp. Gout2]|uniref:potassium-transporting ATPase subunit KdpC n=3 Tax=Glaciimonas TaxID=1229970 RepID=UPI002AB57177|nr:MULTISPECIES: potassium-transporting ATPase subunit KdpC [unclassified Glaciimonas]MDY7547070.1 potassium-transporting ATPase subunit KdpC [Glaciimonas sp. CA11.2]MEB0011085.1 potassium-transporting ATPase subunit KdpC [Glaciimonas sp. Cout2]MEB0081237.1 potassium-transporting ATPase subunit KdpC [Glaciimonas sp. Gout2]